MATDGAAESTPASARFLIEGLGFGETFNGDAAANALSGAFGDDELFGFAGDDNLKGAEGDDLLRGSDGDDLLAGGPGADDLDGGADFDRADYSGDDGEVFVDLAAGVAFDGGGEIDFLTSIEGVIGSRFDDLFVHDGAGARSFDGGDGSDRVDFTLVERPVNVNLMRNRATIDGVDSALESIEEATTGDSDDVLIGDGRANRLTGGGGDDRLDGREGDDVMIGGPGGDIYTVDSSGDVVVEAAGEGTDRINVFSDYVAPEHVEFLVGKFAATGLSLTGNSGGDRITGSNKISFGDVIQGLGGSDKLVGLVGDDRIEGGEGNDRIFGNSGDDVIVGERGNDVLTGQFGADRFVHNPGDQRDVITDFNVAEDTLDLSGHGFQSFAEVQALMTDVSFGMIIDLAGPDAVRLIGVSKAEVGEEDVLIQTG